MVRGKGYRTLLYADVFIRPYIGCFILCPSYCIRKRFCTVTVSELVQQLVVAMNRGVINPLALVQTPDTRDVFLGIDARFPDLAIITDKDPNDPRD